MAPKVVMTMSDWRLDVLLQAERGELTVTEICAQHEISRDTFYRWKRRLEAAGIAGLVERKRTPIHQPRRIPADLEELICRLRRAHPKWGARTIRSRLLRKNIPAPSVSTVHRVLRRNFLVVPQEHKRPRSAMRRFERDEPNDLWQMDATNIKLNNGKEVQVLSIIDDHARFLLAAVCCPRRVTSSDAWQAFTTAASTYGLPRQLLSDNDVAFTGRFRGQETGFERKLRATGVSFIHGRPFHPQTQGKIERLHQTLKNFLAEAGAPDDISSLEALIERFIADYNNHRPHQSLDDATPAERYRPSEMLFEGWEQDPVYPSDAVVRKVSRSGTIFIHYLQIHVGSEWAARKVRVVENGPRLDIYYGEKLIRSLLPDRSRTFQPPSRRHVR